MEALSVQVTLKAIRISCCKIIEEDERVHICEVLIGGCNELSVGTSRQGRLDIRSDQPKARLFDEAHRKCERLAVIDVLLQPIDELRGCVVGEEVCGHGGRAHFGVSLRFL